MLIDVCLCSFTEMSSSKRKSAGDKSANDEKSKPSVFDRLGPEPEVKHLKLNLLLRVFSLMF